MAENPIRKEIPRRTFLIGVVGAVVGFSALGWWRFKSLQTSDLEAVGIPETVADVLRRRLDYLDLDGEGVDRFTQDVQAVLAKIQVSPEGRLLEPEMPVIEGIFFQFQNGAIRLAEDTVVRKYLLSSDFFWNGADESRTVRYLGWFDEYAPCVNPFAVLD